MNLLLLFVNAFSIDEKAIDKAVDPCDDFYQYACGNWIKSTEIPADRSRWERGFIEVQARNQQTLKQILEESKPGTKIGDFYAACANEDKAYETGKEVLDGLLDRIDDIKDPASLATVVAELHNQGINVFFTFGAEPDAKDPTLVIGHASQGGLGLPERDYYFATDAKKLQLKKQYRDHLVVLLKKIGDLRPQTNASLTFNMETALAKGHLGVVEMRDPYKIYHRLERKGLQEKAPHFDWETYFKVSGVDAQAINVAQPEFFAAFDGVLAKLDDVKIYLRTQVTYRLAYNIGKDYQAEAFAFRSAMSGQKQLAPRWRQCVDATDAALGDALAQPFVAKTFGEDGKKEALATIQALEKAMDDNIGALAWMDDATKQAAKEKLGKLFNKIGFPDRWKNYDGVAISRENFVGDVLAANKFERAHQLKKIGKPLDRGAWQMTAPTVNAYYEPTLNEIVFPAGIMQPPYFAPGAPRAMNYGALGMVMGHEITHGFDDEGRQFDHAGRLRDWWSPAVGKQFDERAQCLVKQYDNYPLLGGEAKVNGKLTLGENIADLGGLKLAYLAFKSAEAKQPSGKVAGFTPEQQFFVAHAQSWCSKRRDETVRLFNNIDPHSPPEYRVNGPLSNTPEFAQVFACKAGAKMAPTQRCAVW